MRHSSSPNRFLLTRRDALKALSAAALSSGCGTRRAGPDSLTVLINGEPAHIDPRFPGDALGATISRLAYSGLLDGDPITFVPRLALAESVTQIDPTTVRVRLRSGLRFQDDSPLTSRDVVATYQSIL